MSNIEKVYKIFEGHRERFENTMNAGSSDIAYGHLMACISLLTATMIFNPDAVEVEQMRAAQYAMYSRFFDKVTGGNAR